MDFIVISVLIFLVALAVIELVRFSLRNLDITRRRALKKRLRKYTYAENSLGDIIKTRKLSESPLLHKILSALPVFSKIDKIIIQANAKQSLAFYITLSVILGAVGFIACRVVLNRTDVAALACIALLGSPYIYLQHKKNQRVAKFQAQFHEALDLIARALKAGHSFTNAMNLAADEFQDPLGTEFHETIEEINFGVSVSVALQNMAARIDCKAVQYFIVAVIIQRETGGNLAELIESLAHIIREQFKFEGKVRILSAEGKYSAVLLVLLPFLVGFWIWLSNPNFLTPLFKDEIGHVMIIAASISMVIGMVVMKNMVKIEV